MEASSGEIDSAASGVVRWPVRVETGHYAHPVAPEVYDCVKFLLAREGSGTITGDWGERRFRMGDLMLVGSGLAIGGAPDGRVAMWSQSPPPVRTGSGSRVCSQRTPAPRLKRAPFY